MPEKADKCFFSFIHKIVILTRYIMTTEIETVF